MCLNLNLTNSQEGYLPSKGEKSPQPLVSDEELRTMTEEAINTQAFVFNQLGKQENFGALMSWFQSFVGPCRVAL